MAFKRSGVQLPSAPFFKIVKSKKYRFLFITVPWLCALQGVQAYPVHTCLYSFRDQVFGKNSSQQLEIVKNLEDKEMACLFYATQDEPPLDPGFLIDPNHPERVQKFYGKNSLILFNQFEKHFFFVDEAGSMSVYGYNVFWVGKILKSYGFFFVDPDQRPGELVLEYDLDLSQKIPQEAWDALSNRAGNIKKIKGNRGDLIFDHVKDILHPVAKDVAVGQAVRVRDGEEQHLTYFILLRIPS